MKTLRIVLLGKRGSGKSSAGNTLLGSKPFHTAPSSQGVTQACSMSKSTVDGQKIHVVDTPGWTYSLTVAQTTQEIVKCIDISEPGPHALLLVLSIGRFTKEEIDTAKQIQGFFGEEANNYMMALFTKGDDLEEKTIEEYLEGVHPDLKKVIEICGGRYHVFNNRDKENHKQVSTLIEKIKVLVEKNEGKCYTKAMYEKAAKQTEENQKRPMLLQKMVEEALMRNSDVKSNDGIINIETEEGKHCGNMKGRDSARAKEKECEPNLQEEEESEMVTKNQNCNLDCKNDSNQEDMREGRKSKELCELELKLHRRIDQMEMKWSKEKDELQKEIQQLQIKLEEQKTELEMVKNELQLLTVKTDTYEKLMPEHQQQKKPEAR